MKNGMRVLSALGAALVPAVIAPAQDGGGADLESRATLSLTPRMSEETPRSRVFGEQGSQWWTIGGGAAFDFRDAQDYNLRGAYSYFLIKDVEFSLELNGWYFDQPGDDALGINPSMNFRWHFIDKHPWTVFADVGIGVVFTTHDVPSDGTSVDFTPKAGVGFTHRLGDNDSRLQVGLRWHHVSNGRYFGAGDNPARDGLMLYAGVQWPF